MAAAWGEFTWHRGGSGRGRRRAPISPRSPASLGGVDAGDVRARLESGASLEFPRSRREMGGGAMAAGVGRLRRYSITMQHGRCWEKYLKSSGVAPGQLVSSSSSSSCSCTSPESPVVVSKGQPARGQGALSAQITNAPPKIASPKIACERHQHPRTQKIPQNRTKGSGPQNPSTSKLTTSKRQNRKTQCAEKKVPQNPQYYEKITQNISIQKNPALKNARKNRYLIAPAPQNTKTIKISTQKPPTRT